jgi:hypothetical protein
VNLFSSDATFAMTLRAQVASTPLAVTPLPEPPLLRVSVQEGQIIISWDEEGWTLLGSETLDAEGWRRVENQTSPYLVPSGAAALFFQLTR